MLKKSQRLKRDNFKNLQDARRFFHSEHFLLRAAESPLGPRVGISVSKKVAKAAHIRNRIRRRAYAAITPLIPNLSQKLYLIAAKPGAASAHGETLRAELAELLKKG